MKLTQNEKTLLVRFARCEFNMHNGAWDPEVKHTAHELGTYVFLDTRKVTTAKGDLDVQQLKGVLSSLVKKGLVTVQEQADTPKGKQSDPDLLNFTDAGVQMVEQLINISFKEGDSIPLSNEPVSDKQAAKAAKITAPKKEKASKVAAPKGETKWGTALSMIQDGGATVEQIAAAVRVSEAAARSLIGDVKRKGYVLTCTKGVYTI